MAARKVTASSAARAETPAGATAAVERAAVERAMVPSAVEWREIAAGTADPTVAAAARVMVEVGWAKAEEAKWSRQRTLHCNML